MGVVCDVNEFEARKPGNTNKFAAIEYGLMICSVVGAVGVLVWLVIYSRYGFDFTDEGYYLVWIATPKLYDWSLSQFGYLYHPFYTLLKGNVVLLRVFNVCLTFLLSWLLVDLVVRESFSGRARDKIKRFFVSFCFAIGGLVFFNVWVPSPSYNSLNLQALLIIGAGLFIAQKRISKECVIGWLLIGVGGWLAFMAKPSSAAAVGFIALIYLFISNKINILMMALCAIVVVVLFAGSALLIDGSLIGFERRMHTALDFLNYLGGGHTFREILRFDSFLVSKSDFVIFVCLLVVCTLSVYFLRSNRNLTRFAGFFLVGVATICVFALLFGQVVFKVEYNSFSGLLLCVVPATALLLSASFYWRETISSLSRQRLSAAFLFMLLPHVYAFGTNNNYWQIGSSAGFFWLLAGLVFIAPALRGREATYTFLPLAILTQLVVVILLQRGMELPYRQPKPLRLNSHSVEIGANGSTLVLSEAYAKYLEDVIAGTRLAGFKMGTPMIDLTGQSPGVLYSIGAASIGQAWMIGGYSGSYKLAVEALKKVPCEQLANAWILIEENGPRSISDEIVVTFGASPSDYENMASWDTAKGAGGYEGRPRQALLKPMNSIAVNQSCINIRP